MTSTWHSQAMAQPEVRIRTTSHKALDFCLDFWEEASDRLSLVLQYCHEDGRNIGVSVRHLGSSILFAVKIRNIGILNPSFPPHCSRPD